MYNILLHVLTLLAVLFTASTIPDIINVKSDYSESKLLYLRHQEGNYDLQKMYLNLDKLFKKVLFIKVSGFVVNCCICIGMMAVHKPIISLLVAVLALVDIRIFSLDFKLCDKLVEELEVFEKIIDSTEIR